MESLHNPAPWQSIPSMLDACCQQFGQRSAVIDGDTTLSYQALAQRVDQCASAMAQHGVKPGHCLCIWAPNSWQWIVCAFASWQLGAVVVPISSRLKALEAGPIILRSGARLLFTVGDCAGTDLPDILAASYGNHATRPYGRLPQLEQVICFDNQSNIEQCLGFSDFFGDQQTDNNATAISDYPAADSLCQLLFTSGTTGKPKGVMLDHQQVLQAYWDWSDIGGLTDTDTFLVIPPFSHGFGINAGIIACVMRGMTHVVVDFFNPDSALELIAQHNISVMSGPPALFAALAQRLQQSSASAPAVNSLRVAYVGAAHVPEEMINTMQDTLGIDRVINAYGLIEGCVVSMTRADDSNKVISTSVGRPLPNVHINIVDDNGQPLADGQPGEILLRSYGVMRGYFEAPELTAATIDSDGWLSTGDIGTVDAAGNLTIVGRKKDLFICNGFNVYPAEVEDLLLQHPAITQAAVVGIDHPHKGEVGVAFVITADTAQNNASPQQTIDEHSLLTWAKTTMASYKVPQHIITVTDFPLNANGKVRKDALTTLALQHTHCE